MTCSVFHLKTSQNITACTICPISCYNWGGDYRPPAYAQMGLLEPDTLLVHMWAEESAPAAQYTRCQDPVYLDSALEFFIQFPGSGLYYNFEINSNGAMLAQSGTSKEGRTALSCGLLHSITCRAVKNPDDWHVYLTLPLRLLWPQPSDYFYFNLYKIKESPGQTHFASYAPIASEKPNFHLPRFFARADLL